ncbi:dienelactone hydrolase family protein [Allorhizobium taibaishanense]|uniref:Dienelactone hydrolase n=1 Tax=Allorhizobium taibaishanense TaxID=887144 RepID=A0A1Q9A5A2_9HYPH|nr:dienelactone hydrolase family protein [Allorhizobium taibaishanense]MBB4006852.1 dienelactone hydrolase [Allorhizobium taibaishanense]OLP49735.1 hypothetical protein BJF91_22325 [Allorhizobium taibaishanense]
MLKRLIPALLVAFWLLPADSGRSAEPLRRPIHISIAGADVLVERLSPCKQKACRSVLILSGSKGVAAPTYDDIGRSFAAVGLQAYLVHYLSADDLDAIAKAGSAQARKAFYARRLQSWIAAVQGAAEFLERQGPDHGKVGLLGISLGAEVASRVAADRYSSAALVLVDGSSPEKDRTGSGPFPPLLLIWGSADKTFPLVIARDLQQRTVKAGGTAALDVYAGGEHDFFLKSGTRNAIAARKSAADFLMSHLHE